MEIVKERPREGQYVQLWEYNGEVWSYTLRVLDTGTEKYNEEEDYWEAYHPLLPNINNISFIVL